MRALFWVWTLLVVALTVVAYRGYGVIPATVFGVIATLSMTVGIAAAHWDIRTDGYDLAKVPGTNGRRVWRITRRVQITDQVL